MNISGQLNTEALDKSAPIAYLMSRFPTVTETFVLREMTEMRRLGRRVEVFPLLRQNENVLHDQVAQIMAFVHYTPFANSEIVAANLHWLARKPGTYLKILFQVLRGTIGSANLFVGALGIFPKSVYFARQFERLGIAHIHAHFSTHPTTAALIASELTGIPYSFTAHGHDVFFFNRMLDHKINRSAFTATVSLYNKQFLLNTFPQVNAEKIEIHRCGIEPDRYPIQKHGSESDRPFTLICVAALEQHKGIHHLIRACAIAGQHIGAFRCKVVGKGSQFERLNGLIGEVGLSGTVELLGGRPQEEVASLLAGSDVMVLASEQDALPVALMEGMASGLPIISSRLTGIPELVEHERTGFLTEPGDVEALAGAIVELYNDPQLRAAMGARGRAKVVAQHDLITNVSRLHDRISSTIRSGDSNAPIRARIVGALLRLMWDLQIVNPNDAESPMVDLTPGRSGGDSIVFEAKLTTKAGTAATSRPLIVKLSRPRLASGTDRLVDGFRCVRREFDALAQLWPRLSQDVAGAGELTVARPIGLLSDLSGLVTERCPGVRLDRAMRWATFTAPFFGLRKLERHIENCGRWLARFHTVSQQAETAGEHLKQRDREFHTELEKCADLGLDATLRAKLLDWYMANRLTSLEDQVRVVGRHCDFAPWNVFVSDAGLSVIDLEGFQDGLNLDDVCYFLCHLWSSPLYHSTARTTAGFERRFIAGYQQESDFPTSAIDVYMIPAMVKTMAADPTLSRAATTPLDQFRKWRKRSFYLSRLRNAVEGSDVR